MTEEERIRGEIFIKMLELIGNHNNKGLIFPPGYIKEMGRAVLNIPTS